VNTKQLFLYQEKGLSYKKYCAPLGLNKRDLLRCYQYLAPLVLLGNCWKIAPEVLNIGNNHY
jgi:hypothetical protein